MLTFKPIETKTLPEAVAEQIMAMMADGQLKPGDRLPTEAELAEQFNVGRSTLREGIKSLVMAGLLERRRSAGTFVSASYIDFLSNRLNWSLMLSEQELRHIIEVRYVLEVQTAAFAAERATPAQKKALAQLVEAMGDASLGPDKAIEHDAAFHITIAEAAHNPLLLNLALSIRKLLYNYLKLGYTRRGYTDQAEIEANVASHRAILEAIQAGKSDQARQAMIRHLENSASWKLAMAKQSPNSNHT
jgi:GntR family transcriptional regulator, transcriptional repressor for pyruvate dehydrogenase complex